jgi:lysophospholipase L1-like esterase
MAQRWRLRFACLFLSSAWLLPLQAAPAQKWVTVWTGSVHGPYPSGNASAQPNLSLVFESPANEARDQSFRLIVRPDLWGRQARFRFSNAMGTRPVTFDGAYVGLQLSGAAIVAGTNRPILFAGKPAVTIAPGESGWSDPVELALARDPNAVQLQGRKLAVSFHVLGESGPMTWHAKALTTSYVTAQGGGVKGREESETAFPFPTTSWYFLDAMDIKAAAATRVIVAFGDSITDGTASTLNGDDRWPDVLSRRLHAEYGSHVSIVNAGIGGNQVAGPAEYSARKPFSGGPSAGARLDRDVLSLSGVSEVIWLEGINDFSANGNATASSVETAMREIVKRMRAAVPGIRIVGATVTSALGASGAHGSQEEDRKRQALNEFIRTGGVFDGVADFDKATVDPQTGGLRREFIPESTTGGAGDKLHPNRLGYQAMGMAVDLKLLMR